MAGADGAIIPADSHLIGVGGKRCSHNQGVGSFARPAAFTRAARRQPHSRESAGRMKSVETRPVVVGLRHGGQGRPPLPRLIVATALAIVVAWPARSATTDEWIDLFNGHDFEGWVIEGPPEGIALPGGAPVWRVEDGEIVCVGNRWSFLRYVGRRFSDFELRVEFVMATGGNSGVGIRTGPIDLRDPQNSRPSCYCYEIQLLDDAGQPPSPFSSGSLYRYVAPQENAIRPAGEWNTLAVTCQGPVIDVVLNGRPIHHFDQRTHEETKHKPLEGHVCLQNHGHPIRFRNVRVRPVDAVPAEDRPADAASESIGQKSQP